MALDFFGGNNKNNIDTSPENYFGVEWQFHEFLCDWDEQNGTSLCNGFEDYYSDAQLQVDDVQKLLQGLEGVVSETYKEEFKSFKKFLQRQVEAKRGVIVYCD